MTNIRSSTRLQRREFIVAGTGAVGWLLLPHELRAAEASAPTNNPVAHLKLAWTDEIKWANVIDVTQMPGEDTLEKINAAQQQLAAKGGGVVYFPPGTYQVKDHIHLLDGIVLRGADPSPVTKATDEKYTPLSKLEFPQYHFKAEGNGTPNDTAFKGIHLKNPATASNCGVVNLDLNCGHIFFEETTDHTIGRNRLVYGCRLRNAALPNPNVPDLAMGQHPWQHYTATWERAAVHVYSAENALVANNRLARGGEANFTMDGCLMLDRVRKPVTVDGIIFDYDNRAGIYLNHYGIGGPGGQGPDGTPKPIPTASARAWSSVTTTSSTRAAARLAFAATVSNVSATSSASPGMSGVPARPAGTLVMARPPTITAPSRCAAGAGLWMAMTTRSIATGPSTANTTSTMVRASCTRITSTRP